MEIKRIRGGLKIKGNKIELLDAMLLAYNMGFANKKEGKILTIRGNSMQMEKLERKIKKESLSGTVRPGRQ